MKKMKKGFTIVELVIVVAVIAILAAVLIPVFSNVVEKANQSADQQTCTNYNKIVAIAGATDDDLTLKDVMLAIEENGMNVGNFETKSKTYNFAYDATNKKVVLMENGSIVYPKDAKKNGELWAVLQGRELVKGVANYLLTKSYVLNSNQAISFNGNNSVVIDLNNYVAQLPEGTVDLGYSVTLKNGYCAGTTDGQVTLGAGVLTNSSENVDIIEATEQVYRGFTGTEVVIEGKSYINIGSSQQLSITAEDATKVTLRNCTFSGYQVNVGGNKEIVVENCTFYNAGNWALTVQDDSSVIEANGSFKYTIKNNQFVNCERGINLTLPQGGASVVEGNTFELTHATKGAAVQIGAPSQTAPTANNIEYQTLTIKNNVVENGVSLILLHDGLVNDIHSTYDFKDIISNKLVVETNTLNGNPLCAIDPDAKGDTATKLTAIKTVVDAK